MHVMTLLNRAMFEVKLDGQPAGLDAVFPDWQPHDRFGLVIDEALGGIGASHLLQAAMTLFYDVKPSRRTALTVYPEIYAFHIGKGHGAHAPYDFWPARREVMVSSDHREVLDAINDRAITRLAVPDRAPRQVIHRPKEEDAAYDRLVSAFAYHPSGRVEAADLEIKGTDKRTELNPARVLRPLATARQVTASAVSTKAKPLKEADTSYMDWLRLREADVGETERAVADQRRQALRVDGLATEAYRRLAIPEALAILAGAGGE